MSVANYSVYSSIFNMNTDIIEYIHHDTSLDSIEADSVEYNCFIDSVYKELFPQQPVEANSFYPTQ